MQNKNVIKILILVVALICLKEISYTYFAKGFENEIKESTTTEQEYLAELKERENEEIWLGNTYQECKKREINLGLDLRGGVSVTLEIAIDEMVRSLAGDNANSPQFDVVAKRTKELQTQEQAGYVDLFYKAYKEVGPSQPFSLWFNTLDNEFSVNATDEEVLEVLSSKEKLALDQANQVLRTRVKQFGIAQPDIRKLGASGRIMVDLPGIKDINRVRKLLQGSANLQFWDVYDFTILRNQLDKASLAFDKIYNNDLMMEDPNDSTKSVIDSTKINAQKYNPFKFVNYPFALTIPNKDTAAFNKFIKDPANGKFFPVGAVWAFDNKGNEDAVNVYLLSKVLMEGDIIKEAKAETTIESGDHVSLTFKTSQVANWENITGQAAKTGRPIAIVLDGYVYSAPTCQQAISGGRAIINGPGSAEEWKDLADVLNAGQFPAPAKIVEESFVGPTLGAESIQAGFMSFVIALVVVLIYMIFYYSTAGVVANVALIANIFFIIGALAAFPTISLTLPGVAGIVLTVGMSVDANVLIYERIREELRIGKGLKIALRDGYKHAYTAILDANVTTLITGIILWYFGTGVIESFAQTLVIGIATSLFSAIFITRVIFENFLDKDKDIKFTSSATEKLFVDSAYQIIKGRRKFYLLSGLVIVIGLGSFFGRGFNLGTDFSGGRNYIVAFDSTPDQEEVRGSLEAAFGGISPEVKSIGNGATLSITTKYLYNDDTKEASANVESKLYEGLQSYLPQDITLDKFTAQFEGKEFGIMSNYFVGPTIADDIISAAITSITIAMLAIFLYVAVRFRRWQFGLGALIAIFHDVLIVLSLFSLLHGFLPFTLEINQAFVAAILTVVGYSINDTVVVFDRIREYLTNNKSIQLPELVNKALNSTLSRTFNTSITIVVVLIAILLFGGESIQGFAFALLVGVVVGTYSSLCIATPVYVDLMKKGEENA